ncbi:MAG: KPN_02809 family neutral zinc metallopeptidase [Actinomycetes bacterium]
MEFDDQNVDVSGVDDRRGGGGFGGGGFGGLGGRGVAVGGGGLGIVGVLIFLAVQLLGGGSSGLTIPSGVEQPGYGTDGSGSYAGGPSRSDLQQRCNTDGAIDKYQDCYLIKVYDEINEVWSQQFDQRGATYTKPRLAFFSGQTQTGCGAASAQVGPFYCPADREIYLDIDFLNQLQQQFGATGRYAETYIVAHEAGHHLQTLLGIEPKVRQLQQQDPSRENELSVKLELQADCYAGVYGRVANDNGNERITDAELNEALNAAAAVGDDAIQRQTQGSVNPDTFTHGTSEQRRSWFLKGYQSGQLEACTTFGGTIS